MLNQNLLDNTLHISKGSFKLEKINNEQIQEKSSTT